MANKKRVVITGIGAISPIGIGRSNYWQALADGSSGIGEVTSFDHSNFDSHVAGEVNDFSVSDYLPNKLINRTDRSTHFAIAAMQLALNDSGIVLNQHIQNEAHVILGTAMAGHISYSNQLQVFLSKGGGKVSPFAAVSCFPDACSGQINIFFKLKGPAHTICSGCASSSNAILEGFKRIKEGETDIVFAGGTDAPLSPEIFCGFCQARILSKKKDSVPSPFDSERDGTVLSEGAGILVMESLDSAIKRDATIYGEILGGASTTDAYNMAGSDPDGFERGRAIELALLNSKVTKESVDLINAHATATIQNDSNETAVIKKVFANRAKDLFVNATKSMIGHTQGAAGVLEVIALLQSLKEGIIHPTINYRNFDPACDLNYVPNNAIKNNVRVAIKNSFAFGGKNTVLVFKKFDSK